MNKFIIITLILINTLLLILLYSNNANLDNSIGDSSVSIHDTNAKNFQSNLGNLTKVRNFENLKSPFVITFINNRGCPSCLSKEIEILSRNGVDKFQNYFLVIVNFDELSSLHGINESIKIIKYEDWLISTGIEINVFNPISIVADFNFIYNYRHVDTSKPFEDRLTDSYYSYLEAFFK